MGGAGDCAAADATLHPCAHDRHHHSHHQVAHEGSRSLNGHTGDIPESSGFKTKKVSDGRGYQNLGHLEDEEDSSDLNLVKATQTRSYQGDEGDAVEVEDEETRDSSSRRLIIFGMLNFGYVIAQLIGSMRFGSLALMSDAFHNLSDV